MKRVNVDKMLDWLNQNWQSPKCPICSQNSWHIGEKPLVMKESQGFLETEKFHHFIPITCNICGNTLFFNNNVIDATKEETIIGALSKLSSKGSGQ